MIKYYSLDSKGKRQDLFIAYSDVAAEFNTTRNAIAGKFYRAKHERNSNIIEVNGIKIEQVKD